MRTCERGFEGRIEFGAGKRTGPHVRCGPLEDTRATSHAAQEGLRSDPQDAIPTFHLPRDSTSEPHLRGICVLLYQWQAKYASAKSASGRGFQQVFVTAAVGVTADRL